MRNMGSERALEGFRKHFGKIQRIFSGLQRRHEGVFWGFGESEVRYIGFMRFLGGIPKHFRKSEFFQIPHHKILWNPLKRP